MSNSSENGGSPNTRPKPFVFVLMPFASEFADLYRYGIQKAAEDAGAYAERVDEQHFDGSILSRIVNQINKADVIVADMSGKNPNVFYEVGYAHALGKRVVLLTKDVADIPFDLKHHQHTTYDGSSDSLRPKLARALAAAIQEVQSGKPLLDNRRLVVSINDVELTPNALGQI
ncbi:MAG: nucleoside 2-deoxyribosyltransferase, partial [Phycisphaerales bacterium]